MNIIGLKLQDTSGVLIVYCKYIRFTPSKTHNQFLFGFVWTSLNSRITSCCCRCCTSYSSSGSSIFGTRAIFFSCNASTLFVGGFRTLSTVFVGLGFDFREMNWFPGTSSWSAGGGSLKESWVVMLTNKGLRLTVLGCLVNSPFG